MSLSHEDRELIGAGFYVVLLKLEQMEQNIMSTLADLTAADAELDTEVQAISADVDALNAQIASLQQQLANATGRLCRPSDLHPPRPPRGGEGATW